MRGSTEDLGGVATLTLYLYKAKKKTMQIQKLIG
jgi:hypothetical protein